MTEMTALTDWEKECYDLTTVPVERGKRVLIRAQYRGRDVAVIAGVYGEDETTVSMMPLAMLIDDAMLDEITPPEGGTIAEAELQTVPGSFPILKDRT